MDEPLLQRPYASRQLITVASDETVETATKNNQSPAVQTKAPTWRAIGAAGVLGAVSALRLVRGGAHPLVLLGTAVGAGLTAAAVARELSSLREARRQLQEEGISFITISRSEAKELTFPHGHPRDRVLYVGHPAMPHIYYTAAQFHRFTFEHKFREAINILMALGATEIETEYSSDWSKDIIFSVQNSLPGVSSAANLGIGETHDRYIRFQAKCDVSSKPTLPDNLVWYSHEQMWQQIVEGRLKYGMNDVTLIMRYEDDYGVNSGLKLAVGKVGLDVGGKFQDYQSTVLNLKAKFSGKPSEERSTM